MKAKYKPQISLLQRAQQAEKVAKEAMESAKITFRKAHSVYVTAGVLVTEIEGEETNQAPEKQDE